MADALFPLAEFITAPEPLDRLAAKAAAWMEANPDIMAVYELRAVLLGTKGQRFGISQLTESIRWDPKFKRKSGKFRIPNNHSAYIARELIRLHPSLAAFVDLHPLRSEQE